MPVLRPNLIARASPPSTTVSAIEQRTQICEPDARSRDIAQLSASLEDLFSTLPGREEEWTHCPFNLAATDTDEKVEMADQAGQSMDRDSLCYGEISIAALAISLFEGAEATPSDSFLDLGSGSGKAVLAAAALGLRQVAGMELLPSLVELSRHAARTAGVWSSWPAAVGQAHFVQGDILDDTLPWWSDAFWQSSYGWRPSLIGQAPSSALAMDGVTDEDVRDDEGGQIVGVDSKAGRGPPSIIYCCATKFGPKMRAQLYERLRLLPDGTRIIISTHALRPDETQGHTSAFATPRGHSDRLVEVWRRELPFSWGTEVVRVYHVARNRVATRRSEPSAPRHELQTQPQHASFPSPLKQPSTPARTPPTAERQLGERRQRSGGHIGRTPASARAVVVMTAAERLEAARLQARAAVAADWAPRLRGLERAGTERLLQVPHSAR